MRKVILSVAVSLDGLIEVNEKLIDEMWLGLVPIVLGKGKPLFSDIHQRAFFKLVEAIPKEGYVSLYYKYDLK
jgi:dihydrofolate reductase